MSFTIFVTLKSSIVNQLKIQVTLTFSSGIVRLPCKSMCGHRPTIFGGEAKGNLIHPTTFPPKLSHKHYSLATPSDDRDVDDIVTSMESELDQLLQSCTSRKPKKRKQNLTPEEKAGLK